jgi:O-antigen/teichoic acid export membrane protein
MTGPNQPPRAHAFRAWMQRPLVRRVLAATGSNAYAQATTIGIQLLSLPLFLSHWDLATYGQWMVLSALPAYLAMADAGMVTAAGNRMTMLMGEGRPGTANEVFQSAAAFVLAVCGAALLLVLAAAAWWPVDAGPGHGSVDGSMAMRGAIVALSAGVVVALVGGLPEAVYKATHRYALGAALANTTRLLEWLGSLAGLWWGGDFLSVAIGALAPRVVCTLAMGVHAARSTTEFRWGFGAASLAEVRRCAAPALSFMAFPAANALNFQGMTLISAALLGPAATVVFNTSRTLARVTVQATATFSHALWPEFSRLYGQNDRRGLLALYQRSRGLGLVLAALASGVVYLAAPAVLNAWSKGRIAFDEPLMLVAMAYAAAAGASHVSRVLLMSTNEHTSLAVPYLAASVAGVPLAWVMARALGLPGIMGAMLLVELGVWWFCAHQAKRLLAPAVPSETFEAAA